MLKKKISLTIAGCVAALGLVMGSAVAANASSFGPKSCGAGARAYVAATTVGNTTLYIVGTNGVSSSLSKNVGGAPSYNRVTSPTQSASYGSVSAAGIVNEGIYCG